MFCWCLQAQGVVKAQEDNVARMAKEHHARVSEMLESADAAIKQVGVCMRHNMVAGALQS